MLLLGRPRVSEPLQQILGLECPSTDLWGAALHTWPQLSDASVHGILLLSATRAVAGLALELVETSEFEAYLIFFKY
jgi:hypothetical protein